MASVLTEHVRTFSEASDPTQEVLQELKRLLRYHMKRKNLLFAPPEILGYPEVTNWSAKNAFDDILVDCYKFAILDRLTALQSQLRTKPNVNGLISRNVASFLLERQRKYDLIGYAVFANVREAVNDLESQPSPTQPALTITNRVQRKLTSRSILRWGGDHSAQLATSQQIREQLERVSGWTDAVKWLTEMSEEGRAWVRGFLGSLPAAGINAVLVGDLVDVLASRVRLDWRSLHATPARELALERFDETGKDCVQMVRIIMPDDSIESRERWEQLKRIIPQRIASLNRQARVRERLAKVFDALVRVIDSGAEPPTQAELGEQTGIARATLSDDMRLLREIIAELNTQNSDDEP
jgi:hypothetical protein